MFNGVIDLFTSVLKVDETGTDIVGGDVEPVSVVSGARMMMMLTGNAGITVRYEQVDNFQYRTPSIITHLTPAIVTAIQLSDLESMLIFLLFHMVVIMVEERRPTWLYESRNFRCNGYPCSQLPGLPCEKRKCCAKKNLKLQFNHYIPQVQSTTTIVLYMVGSLGTCN